MEGAVPLSIFAEMPSGPDALLVSRTFNRLKTSCSVHRMSSEGGDKESAMKFRQSISLKGGIVSLKLLENTSLSRDAFSAFEVTSVDPRFKVRTWLDDFLRYLIVFQNCLLPRVSAGGASWTVSAAVQPHFLVTCTWTTEKGNLLF